MSAQPEAQPEGLEPAPAGRQQTYGRILKSSALIGASSLIEIALRIVRTKAMAVLLGPAGVGLMGLYQSITDLVGTVAGMGVNSSGIREVARYAGTDDTERIARTVRVLRALSIALGALGALFLVAFARQASDWTFDGAQPAELVALVSLVVLFRVASGGPLATLQGTRRIADLARIAATDAVLGTAITVAIVWAFREAGLVPALVAGAATSYAIAWAFGRRVALPRVALSGPEVRRIAAALLTLGMAFMVSGLLLMGSSYLVRVAVLRELGVEAAGLYQAAWAVGGLYLNFILQAMGTDFYPRLTAAIDDEAESNRLINEQIQVGMLLAGPGVLATLALIPLLITLLYSAQFQAAVEPLRWICFGMMLRVVSYPMGFIVVAKSLRTLHVAIDLSYSIVHVVLAWLLVPRFGVTGAGIAFFGSCVFHAVLIYPIAVRLTGFAYSRANQGLLLLFLSLVGLLFAAFETLPTGWAMAAGVLAAGASGVFALRTLARLVPIERAPPLLRRVLNLFGGWILPRT